MNWSIDDFREVYYKTVLDRYERNWKGAVSFEYDKDAGITVRSGDKEICQVVLNDNKRIHWEHNFKDGDTNIQACSVTVENSLKFLDDLLQSRGYTKPDRKRKIPASIKKLLAKKKVTVAAKKKKRRVIHCGNCKQPGHNRRSCKAPKAE